MRVSFLTDGWQRNGGVGAYLWRLAAALIERGDEVQVVHADARAASQPGVHEVQVPGCAAFGPTAEAERASADAALDAIAAFRPDVVHVQDGNNFTLEAGVRARYRAVKSLHVYDFCPSNTKYHHALDRHCTHPTSALCLPRLGYKRCTTSRRPGVWLALQRRAHAANRNNAGYHSLIVASRHVREQALATGYPPGQVTVVPYFVTPAGAADDDSTRPATAARQPGGPPDVPEILTGGRIVREKGFDLFVDALARVPRPWRAIVAGDGMERAAVEDGAARAGLADLIEFAGWQDERGMDALYRRASVVVMPSRWPEPSGILGLEAMAHGRPVAAFAVGGIPEWLGHGETGLLVAPLDSAGLGDAIATLLSDPAAAARMGARGRDRAASQFSAARHLARLDEVYAALPEPQA